MQILLAASVKLAFTPITHHMKTSVTSPIVPQPEYSEHGPVWTVCPMERVPECETGTETVWLVVDLDYDTKNFCGKCIAECSNRFDAICVANALNKVSQQP